MHSPEERTKWKKCASMDSIFIGDPEIREDLSTILMENRLRWNYNLCIITGTVYDTFCLKMYILCFWTNNALKYSLSDRSGGISEVLAAYETEDQLDDARDSGIDYFEIGVVGILFKISPDDNPAFDDIFSIFDRLQYPLAVEDDDDCQQQSFMLDKPLDLDDLIPFGEDIGDNGYFSYEGSLTAPPCTTNGIWSWSVSYLVMYDSQWVSNMFIWQNVNYFIKCSRAIQLVVCDHIYLIGQLTFWHIQYAIF